MLIKDFHDFKKILGEMPVLCTDSEYHVCSSLAAWKSASTLRLLFWLHSQLLNLADEPDVYSLLLQFLWDRQTDTIIHSNDNTSLGLLEGWNTVCFRFQSISITNLFSHSFGTFVSSSLSLSSSYGPFVCRTCTMGRIFLDLYHLN